MKTTEATQQVSGDPPPEVRRNGFLNAHQGSTDEEDVYVDEVDGCVVAPCKSSLAKSPLQPPSPDDVKMTNGAEPKKSLIATLGGTHVKTDDFPALNGGAGGAPKFETVRINNVGTRLSDDRTFRRRGEDPRSSATSSTSATSETNGCRLLNGASKAGEAALINAADSAGKDSVAAVEDDDLGSSWDRTVAEVKEQAFTRLQEELKRAHLELRLRDEEVSRLSRIREEVESELEDLTASLFQEAHNMVREANVRQLAAEKSLKESQMQVDVLMAEVAALKTLVLTSTPSRPNPHLHPQIDPSRTKDDASITGVSLFTRKHRRSPSHFNLKYGRENSPPESPVKESRASLPEPVVSDTRDGCEVDPVVHREFVAWRQVPCMDKSDPFILRIYTEDIDMCLDFCNVELAARVRSAVETGNIFIEAVSDKAKNMFPKKCALLEAPRQCHYRMKLGDQEQWYCISQICRNRITAVCDFLNYLRYIERGLVKSSVHDVYWEIVRLRKEIVLARLGLPLSS